MNDGPLSAYDADPNAPVTRLGFQGLFFERFYYRTGEALGANPGDPPSDPPLAAQDPATGLAPVGLCHNRHRWLDPRNGRFISRDAHATALLVGAVVSENSRLTLYVDVLDVAAHFADGVNLYASRRSSPFRFGDATGGVSLELTGIAGMALGYLKASILLGNHPYGSMALFGVAGTDAWLNKGKGMQRVLKPGAVSGRLFGRWGRELLERFRQRYPAQISGQVVGLASSGLAHAVVFTYAFSAGTIAAAMDDLESFLDW